MPYKFIKKLSVLQPSWWIKNSSCLTIKTFKKSKIKKYSKKHCAVLTLLAVWEEFQMNKIVTITSEHLVKNFLLCLFCPFLEIINKNQTLAVLFQKAFLCRTLLLIKKSYYMLFLFVLRFQFNIWIFFVSLLLFLICPVTWMMIPYHRSFHYEAYLNASNRKNVFILC